MSSSNPELPLIAPTSRVLWEGYRFRAVANDDRPDRQYLVSSDGDGLSRELMRRDIPALIETGTIIVEEDIFNPDGSLAPDKDDELFAGMTGEIRFYCTWMEQWALEMHRGYKAGEFKLYPKSIDPWVTSERQDTVHMAALAALGLIDPDKPLRATDKLPYPRPIAPSASGLKRCYQEFRKPAHTLENFEKQHDRCVAGGKRLDDAVLHLTECVIMEYHADERRMNIAAIQRDIKAKLNKDQPPGKWDIRPPDRRTIQRVIVSLVEARVIGARDGTDAMENQTSPFSEGERFSRVGEMVQLDGYKLDLVVMLRHLGVWLSLPKQLRIKLKRHCKRVWICVVLDLATRCVLGFSFSLSENPEAAVRALRMAVSDKSHFAIVSKCEGEPIRPMRIEAIRTDSGTAFRSKRFRTVAIALTKNTQIGVVKKSRHRGAIERLFRTIHESFLPYFTGRTFSNVVERGAYDPVARVTMFLEDFGDSLFRWFNDCYHYLGHRRLDNQAPRDCLTEKECDTGYPPAMGVDMQRKVFGIELERTLTALGIRVAGIQYNANWLGSRTKGKRGKKTRVKVDPQDLGRISVEINGIWQTLPGPPEMQGIPLSFWLIRCRALAKKYGEQAEINFEIVGKALLSFGEVSAAAKRAANLEDWSYNSKSLMAAEAQIRLRLVYRPTPAAHGGKLMLTASTGYITGANFLAGRASTLVADNDASEVYRPDEDEEVAPSEDDQVADNDNLVEDEFPVAASPSGDTKSRPVRKAPKKPPKRAVVDTAWVPAPRINDVKSS